MPGRSGARRALATEGPLRRIEFGDHLGSEAILRAIEEKQPKLAVCGHIHESWGARSHVGPTEIINLGPEGHTLEA